MKLNVSEVNVRHFTATALAVVAAATTMLGQGDLPARSSHYLIQESGSGRVLLFGASGAPRAMWEWGAGRWMLRAEELPEPRGQGAVAYDRRRDRAVLFGGMRQDATSLSDTWEWADNTWRKASSEGPPARDHHVMAYDAHRQRTVLFGGVHRPSTDRTSWRWLSDLWEWDGATWQRVEAVGPAPRIATSLIPDARGNLILFGGGDPGARNLGDTWSWDGRAWTRIADSGPPARRGHAVAYDTARQAVILYGGVGEAGPLGDMWQWTGTAWLKIPAVDGPSPGARFGHAMVYDRGRNVTILDGGHDGKRLLDDTWAWDGRSWTRMR